jgi:succinate dehydrogenase flavin-adding protein (antitoxin of CptAB toxin-antitoxin module)
MKWYNRRMTYENRLGLLELDKLIYKFIPNTLVSLKTRNVDKKILVVRSFY